MAVPHTLVLNTMIPSQKKINLMKCEVPVHIWDVGNTKSPVEGGARCSVEDARDAANLTLENVKIEERKRPART